MAGRRAKWRVAACEAAMQGRDTVTLYGKSGQISAWLSQEELANPAKHIDKLREGLKKAKRERKNPEAYIEREVPPKDTAFKPKGEVCFIIANGESRKGFDLHKLRDKGYIIGMNVLPIIENFWPDALVSVDIATVKWLCERDVPNKTEHWTYPRGGVKDPRPKRLQKDWGWSSGPTATRLALEYKKFQTLYIIGMDFFGITTEGKISEKDGSKINNMYKGQERYRKANSGRTYYGNWLNQMVTNCTNHPSANFYHVMRENQKSPNKLAVKTNWIDINYNVFEEHLQKMTKNTP